MNKKLNFLFDHYYFIRDTLLRTRILTPAQGGVAKYFRKIYSYMLLKCPTFYNFDFKLVLYYFHKIKEESKVSLITFKLSAPYFRNYCKLVTIQPHSKINIIQLRYLFYVVMVLFSTLKHIEL